jgi:hypothetical protein
MKRLFYTWLIIFPLFAAKAQLPGKYQNFTVSVYARAYEVREMNDLQRLETIWNLLEKQLKVDKIYLETHRDQIIVDEQTLETAKKFFESRGIRVAGGITYTIDERNHFETFCYSNPEHRRKAREIAELTARHFDEFILDDFFFTSCKCDLCIAAKGDLSWTQFRLNLMTEAAHDLIIGPAKAVNPDVKIVIKYPNWYEHFQGLGFNLESEPKMFDGIYTGTETRDPVWSAQHLQQYESYLIFRYFNNISPGRNGGGWVDPGGASYLDRYAEQLWLTLFAKAPEITLFDFRQLQTAIRPDSRASWQGIKTSFDFDEMMTPIMLENGEILKPVTIARAAGYSLEKADKFLGVLGNPIGIKSYRPYHALGEDFLQNYLGMIGIPMDIVPQFPDSDQMILLTESAKYDPYIVEEIKERLKGGKNVMITSGLLRSLQGRGIEDIVELRYTSRKALVSDFMVGWGVRCKPEKEILIPEIDYLTNDSWEDISAINGASGWPFLHQAQYSKGYLYVLVIPDNFSDLYSLPPEVLNRIRTVITQDLGLRLEGASQVSLFVYDNGTCVVESFRPEPVTVKIIANGAANTLSDVLTGEEINGQIAPGPFIWGRPRGEVTGFEVTLKPHSYRVFRMK